MAHEDNLRTELRALLGSQRLAVLSTHDEGQPYASLVAFATSSDLSRILFATARTTRKFHNMANDARVALLVDNRSNTERDFHQATAVTVIWVRTGDLLTVDGFLGIVSVGSDSIAESD
jgi:heme iron utilization protein